MVLPEYKVFNGRNWIKIIDNEKIFSYYKGKVKYIELIKSQIKEDIYIYKFDDILIPLIKNKHTFPRKLSFLFGYKQTILLLFLFSFNFKKNKKFLIISEKRFFNLINIILSNQIEIIFNKYGSYTFKNIFSIDWLNELNIKEKMECIYYLIFIFGQKIYGNHYKIMIIKNICNSCKIDYNIKENFIEVFIITKKDLINKEHMLFKEINIQYFTDIQEYIFIKIGKYILLI